MSLAGLSLRDLEYLVAVDECRHFGRAAVRCGVSQPALSAQVRKPEAFLGVEVFERAPRGVLVTRRGATLLDPARAVLAGARALLDAARAEQGSLEGPFRLGAIPTLGPYVLRPMRDAFPAMRPVLSEDRSAGLLAALHADALDAALPACRWPTRRWKRTRCSWSRSCSPTWRTARPPGRCATRAAAWC